MNRSSEKGLDSFVESISFAGVVSVNSGTHVFVMEYIMRLGVNL